MKSQIRGLHGEPLGDMRVSCYTSTQPGVTVAAKGAALTAIATPR